MSNNLLRIVTAVVGIPLVLGMTYVGGWAFVFLVLVLALGGQYELYRLLDAAGLTTYKAFGLVLGGLMVVQSAYPPALGAALALLVAGLALWPFGLLSGRRDGVVTSTGAFEIQEAGLREKIRPEAPASGSHQTEARGGARPEAPSSDPHQPERSGDTPAAASLPATLFGVVYPSALLAALVHVRLGRGPDLDDTGAFSLTLAVFLFVWAADTSAYYAGRALGRRRLAPAISPGKTWAGAVGGIAGPVVFGLALKPVFLAFLAWGHVAVLALVCAVVAQFGDLLVSKWKRVAGVKDSGRLLPGHGGILDRFDSLILVAPAAYLYLRYVADVIP